MTASETQISAMTEEARLDAGGGNMGLFWKLELGRFRFRKKGVFRTRVGKNHDVDNDS